MDTNIDIKKRLHELADKAYRENRYVFTDFLSTAQLSSYFEIAHEFSAVKSLAFGGKESAERCIIRFGDEESLGYTQDFPITLLKISPINRKFADKLTHRDFLGSITGLGLLREKTGDIIVVDNCLCYVFVIDTVAEYIIDNLGYVRHTHVKVEKCNEIPPEIQPQLTEEAVIVNSNRLDAVISKVYKLSRDASVGLIADGKVFINGITMTGNAKSLKENDLVSVRGYGRFIFDGVSGNTRKDKLYIKVRKYV